MPSYKITSYTGTKRMDKLSKFIVSFGLALLLAIGIWVGAYVQTARYETVIGNLTYQASDWQSKYEIASDELANTRQCLNNTLDQITELKNRPPETIAVPYTVTITKEVQVPVEVYKYIKELYNPIPFQSTQEAKDWIANWTPHAICWGTFVSGSACEGFAYAMMIDLVNDGKLGSAQIDPYNNHMVVCIPIYTENRYLFVDATDKTVSVLFSGREWRIN